MLEVASIALAVEGGRQKYRLHPRENVSSRPRRKGGDELRWYGCVGELANIRNGFQRRRPDTFYNLRLWLPLAFISGHIWGSWLELLIICLVAYNPKKGASDKETGLKLLIFEKQFNSILTASSVVLAKCDAKA